MRLPRVIFDDVLLADGRLVQFFANGHALHRAGEVRAIGFDPSDTGALVGARDGGEKIRNLSARLADLDLVAALGDEARDVEALAVDEHVVVFDELPGRRARHREAHPVYDAIEAPLEQADHLLAGAPLRSIGLAEVTAELTLEHTVDATHLLLLTKAKAVLAHLDAALAMLAGRVGAAGERALFGEATVALQVELHPFATTELADRADVARHGSLSILQTRRRFGGRQP